MCSSLPCTASLSLGFRRSPPLRTQTLAAAPSIQPLSNLRLFSRDSWLAGAASSSARRGGGHVVCASDSSSPAPEASGKSKANRSNEAAEDGPPPLTILAAAVVFLLFCWVVGSVVVWLVGLIMNAPRSRM